MPETNTTAMPPSMTTMLDALSTDHGATVVDLAQRGRLGRSTAAKVLTTLEARGLARRQSAERTGGTRTPDLWFATTPHAAAQAQEESAQREPAATSDAGPDAESATAQHGESHDEHTSEAEGGGDQQSEAAADDEVEPDTADTAERADGATATGAAAPADDDTPTVTATQADAATSPRLAKGGLRALVVDYLTAHPGEEMTAPKIGKSLGRSSGAVANALDTLVKNGQAELTREKPRTFRHRAAQTGN
jgi:predicted transcriptional regulator